MNKTYPTLYSRDSKGKVREWRLEQKDNAYRTIAGLQDGEKVVSEWMIVDGKNIGRSNETSPTEQAKAELKAKYVKQLKSGYFKDIKDVDVFQFVEPMLAKKLKDRLNKITFPAALDRKYNGGRVVTTCFGSFSRKGEVWKTIPHIFESIKDLFIKFPNLVTDGEAYNHEYRFKLNELMSILRKQKDVSAEDLDKSKEIIRYYVYDGYGFETQNDILIEFPNGTKHKYPIGTSIIEESPMILRREALKTLFAGYEFIVVVDYKIVNNLEELYKHYESFVEDGYEGAMYRTIDAPYSHSRSSDLLKVKPEDSSEGIVKKVIEGSGNWSGAAKTATILWKGKEFDATFKGQYEDLQKILKDPKDFLNKKVTFLYNGLTGYGVPNYARIDIANCFKS